MLPRIFSFKKIFLFSLFLFIILAAGLIQPKTASAQACPAGWCPLIYCFPAVGCMEPGGVAECYGGIWRECIGGQWVETDKRTPTPDLYHINPWESSLEKFQTAVQHCALTGSLNSECYIGGGELMEQDASSGIVTNTLNAATTAIAGYANPDLLQAAKKPVPSALDTATTLIAGLYSRPPASSGEYLADLGRNLGIAPKPAYAQGVGFQGLNPVLELWKKFRNIAYLLFVVVFVITGFAIMFRVKLDPQTVVSIQTALPRIVVALILVTFSYAIAGFMIDLIYVFIRLIFALFTPDVTPDVQRNLFSIAGEIFGGVIGAQIATNLGSQLNNLVQGIFQGLGGQIFGFAVSALATAVFAIAIAFSLFRLFFSLLLSYISIIVGVIFSPLILVLEAVPGQRGLGTWIKMMLSNMIVFPVTAGILAIAKFLTQGAGTAGGEIWVAPFLAGTAGTPAGYISTLIAVGMLLMAPSLVDQVKKAIGAPGIGAGVMAPVAAGFAVVSAPVRSVVEPVREVARKERGLAIARKLRLAPRGQRPGTGQAED